MIPFVDINQWEFIVLIVLALVLIGPERLPEYVAKLRTWIRQARDMAEGAKTQLKEQMGPEYQDVNWRQYDPRQYDPRKIVREALFDDPDADVAKELGLTDAQQLATDTWNGADGANTGSTAVGQAGGVAQGAGAHQAMGVGAEAATVGVGATSVSNTTYHPDRATPFDTEAT